MHMCWLGISPVSDSLPKKGGVFIMQPNEKLLIGQHSSNDILDETYYSWS